LVEGPIKLSTSKRNAKAQTSVGGEDREFDDDGGHLIASIFGGSGEFINLTAMKRDLNRYGKAKFSELSKDDEDYYNIENYRDMERFIESEAKKGKKLYFAVQVYYDGNKNRPSRYEISISDAGENGVPGIHRSFSMRNISKNERAKQRKIATISNQNSVKGTKSSIKRRIESIKKGIRNRGGIIE